ncbi:hypothetical protein [Streptomyces sp. KM273126]|nr:hypothetical protein [Streptomyces sp. KM273126]
MSAISWGYRPLRSVWVADGYGYGYGYGYGVEVGAETCGRVR